MEGRSEVNVPDGNAQPPPQPAAPISPLASASMHNTRATDWVGKSPCSYWTACACLIALAAGLRFYELSANSLWLDEALVATFTQGSFFESWGVVRERHSSPPLYPLVLWLVQKVESSAFSVRVLPATASVLVVAGMALLLPRFVGRWPAFQAALLFTFSTQAIRQARDAREYSIDALVAVLMLVGLLAMLRSSGTDEADRRGGGGGEAQGFALLCVALFAAPLVQYGLVLLCFAILAALVLARFIRLDGARNHLGSPWNETRRFPVGHLVWLFGSFAAGCCISYVATLRDQWQPGGYAGGHGGNMYLAHGYYDGAYTDPLAALVFLAGGARNLVTSYLTFPWVFAFAIGFGIALVRLRARFDVVTVVASLAFAFAALAGLLRVYPLFGGRHAMYLVPVLLVATTHATYQAVSRARPWIVHATMVLLAAVTVASGVMAVAGGHAYAEKQDVKSVLSVLDGRIQEGDAVYVAKAARAAVRFYAGAPSNYHFSERPWGRRNLLLNDAFAKELVEAGVNPSNRLYIINSHSALPDFRLLALFYEGVAVKRVVSGKGNTSLHMLEAPELMDKLAVPATYLGMSGDPVIESAFDVYVTNDMLLLVREQCRRGDIEHPFFVQTFPANADDLPVGSVARGFEERSFPFIQIGVMMDHTCAALVSLPGYPIDRVRVGQGAQSPQRESARGLPLARKSPLWSGEAVVDRGHRSSGGPLHPHASPATSSSDLVLRGRT